MNDSPVKSVLKLKPAERLRLAEVIYSSLDRPDDAIDQSWCDEAERRLAAARAGRTQPVPAEQVIGKRP